ncbi:MAG: chromosomal replication initiator protein DnaA [Patescibacteria group bacterium]|jgi:chromosomal replication initiator protein
MTNEQLWEATLGELELSLSKANFTTWFKNTFIAEHNEKEVVIGVPNAFTKAWFEKKYHVNILKSIQHSVGEHIKTVTYTVAAKPSTVSTAQATVQTITPPVTTALPAYQPQYKTQGGLHLDSKYTFDTFIVGKSSELAYATCKAVAKTPGTTYNPLFLYGGSGLGKTHLIQAIANELLRQQPSLKIIYVTCEKFTNDFIQSITRGSANDFKTTYRSADVLLIDDIQFLSGKEGTQEEFFHTFNALHQSHKQIVLTSDRAPKAIPGLENRLVSRFEWGMMADVQQPDVETRTAILEAKCRERKYTLSREILQYIANNIQTNVRELEGALNRIVAFHDLNNTVPSLESIKALLQSVTQHQKREGALTPKQVMAIVSGFYEISLDELKGNSRKKELVLPRQITMYLLREDVKSSYPTIGQELGGRDHTTAIHAFEKIKAAVENDEKIREDINLLRQRLYSSRS